MKGYIARDENGKLYFFPGSVKPVREYGVFFPVENVPHHCIYCPNDNIDITWEDEPREAFMTMHLDVEPK